LCAGFDATNLDGLELNQLTGGDGALLAANSPTEGFGPLSKTYLAAHFELQGNTGEIQMWSRTRS
jgi:hypothetical protein